MNDLVLSTYKWIKGFSWDNFRSKTFVFLLYPEWETFDQTILLLKESPHEFLAISPCHDSDKKSDGTPDKPHYHGCITFKNQVWAYSFCRRFHISIMPERLKDKYGNRTGFILYMSHSDEKSISEGKHQYAWEDIWSDHPQEIAAIYSRPVVYRPDNIDTIDFLTKMDFAISSGYFNSELQIANWAYCNGYDTLFHKFKYQIHSDFMSYKARKTKDKNYNINKRGKL